MPPSNEEYEAVARQAMMALRADLDRNLDGLHPSRAACREISREMQGVMIRARSVLDEHDAHAILEMLGAAKRRVLEIFGTSAWDEQQASRLDEEGFLADQTGAVIAVVRQRWGPWLAEFRKLNRLLVSIQLAANVQPTNAQHVLCVGLFVRGLSHAQAAVLLLERGIESSAKVVIRCAWEATFVLVASSRDYETAVDYVEQFYVQGQRAAKGFGNIEDPQARADMDEAMRQRILAESTAAIKELELSEIKIWEMAKRAGLQDKYRVEYSYLSGAVHSTASDLVYDHFTLDDEGKVIEMRAGPDYDRVGQLLVMLAEAMTLMADAMCTVFSLPSDGTAARHVAALQALTVDRSL